MKLYQVTQSFESRALTDLRAAVFRQLDALGLDVPQGDVALTAGSRGIAHIALITRAVGDWLKTRGATPFIVPCMGSHNGATADGQRAMIESLGITEDAMDMEIRSAMDVVKIGEVQTGAVYMDRHCCEAAGVVVMNRIKLHTAFAGPLQSGLVKMMVVGMGKVPSARTFHSATPDRMAVMLEEMGQRILDSGRILAGVAILEDGYDQTAEIHAVPAEGLIDAEKRLLERHRKDFPSLPVERLNVLVVETIGKTFSGTGMDTNVIGRRGIRGFEDLPGPKIHVIAALGLHPSSQGNALGVGLADFITERLRDAIDPDKTRINVVTSGYPERGKIPVAFADDMSLIESLAGRYGEQGWMFIPDTLHLATLYVSEDVAEALKAHPQCSVDPTPIETAFRGGRLRLPFHEDC